MEDEISEIYHEAADRRADLRSPIIVLKVTEKDGRQVFFGYAKNISRSGLFISSINPRVAGERFSISFQLPETKISVNCQCEVVWTREYKPKAKTGTGYGVRFLDLSGDVAMKMDKWIAGRL